MRPESASGLYWSIRGTVLCGRHAKDIEDERWAPEEWYPLPESSQGLQQYQCQRCSPDGTALADSGARSRHSNGKWGARFAPTNTDELVRDFPSLIRHKRMR